MVVVGYIFGEDAEFIVVGFFQDFVDDACTFGGVHFHFFKFFGSEAAGLAEHRVINGDLPEVVHGRCFDDIRAEFVGEVQSAAGVVFDFSDQDTDAFTRTADVSAGGVVPAFNHGRHTEDQVVVHINQVLRLLLHFLLQLGIVVIEQGDVLLALGVVGDVELVPFLFILVVEVLDVDLEYLFSPLEVENVFGFVLAEFTEPCKQGVIDKWIHPCGTVHGQFLQLREDRSGRFGASEVAEFEIHGDKSDLTGLEDGIDHGIADVIKRGPVRNREIHDLGKYI